MVSIASIAQGRSCMRISDRSCSIPSNWSGMSVRKNRGSIGYHGCSMGNNGCMGYNRSSGMRSMALSFNYCIETIVRISSVVYGTSGAVGFNQAVMSLNGIAFTLFRLFLYVTGVCIMNSIAELVVSWGLKSIPILF